MMSKIIPESQIAQVNKLIDEADHIVIVCHVSPDGDAVSSTLGLYHFLSAIDKEATVIVPDALPDNLLFLPVAKDILIYSRYTDFANELIQKADLIFCLDFNALKRIDMMELAIKNAGAKKIMVDHHLDPEQFCNVTISHPEISSTCELVFRLICRMGMFDDLNVQCATAIYTGMMTDTGNFTYNSNKSDIYFIIEELVKKGIDKDKIYAKVCNTNSVDKLRLNGYAVSQKMEIFPEYRAAMISLTREELNRYHYRKGDSEGLVNVPLSIENIVCSVFLREETGFIKVSLRSKGTFPVNKIAAEHFNGGGHLNASGGEFFGTMEEAQECFRKLLPLYVRYLKD